MVFLTITVGIGTVGIGTVCSTDKAPIFSYVQFGWLIMNFEVQNDMRIIDLSDYLPMDNSYET